MKLNYVKKYHRTGPCKLYMENVVFDWKRIPHLWWISQYKEQYRIIRYLRKNSVLPILKVIISSADAFCLIKKMNLVQEKSPVFSCVSSYKLRS